MLFCCPDDLGTADFITEEEKKLSGTTVIILIAFVFYLAMMIVIGAVYMKKTSSSEDYFLGGRGLNGWVAALSAQASDMSGWLLMGLPGGVYALGTGQSWIAIGLFLGTVVNWLVISGPLRRYTIRANNSLTLPTYFENRFHDKKKVLLLISSITIVIFFLVYTASALASGGKLFNFRNFSEKFAFRSPLALNKRVRVSICKLRISDTHVFILGPMSRFFTPSISIYNSYFFEHACYISLPILVVI